MALHALPASSAESSRPPPADFESPLVGVRPAGHGKGRGLFALAPLPARALVLSERALALAPAQAPPGELLDRVLARAGAAGAAGVESLALLYSLSPGPGFPADPPRGVDAARVAAILRENQFSLAPDETLVLAEMYNWLATPEGQQADGAAVDARYEAAVAAYDGAGLWPRAALLNHSCAPNCDWSVAGEMLSVRTQRPVAAGEELCHCYVDVQGTRAARGEALRARGFACACDRCAAEDAAGRPFAGLEAAAESAVERGDDAAIARLLSAARALPPPLGSPRLRLAAGAAAAALRAGRPCEALALRQEQRALLPAVWGCGPASGPAVSAALAAAAAALDCAAEARAAGDAAGEGAARSAARGAAAHLHAACVAPPLGRLTTAQLAGFPWPDPSAAAQLLKEAAAAAEAAADAEAAPAEAVAAEAVAGSDLAAVGVASPAG